MHTRALLLLCGFATFSCIAPGDGDGPGTMCEADGTCPIDMDAVPDDSVMNGEVPANTTTGDNPPGQPRTEEVADEGDFVVVWEDPSTSYYEPWQRQLQESQIFEGFAELLNAEFKLPQDIAIVHRECGSSDAFYDAESSSVVMCYDLIDQLSCGYSSSAETEMDLAKATIDSWVFIFFHEVGHALIDVYDLPATDEEAAADQFAALTLIDAGYSDEVGIASAQFPLELTFQPKYLNEHGQMKNRFFGTNCLLYGSDPEHWAELPAQWPQLQSDLCIADFAEKTQTWDLLLEGWQQ